MLVACKEDEPLFIFRALQGKLRIGLAESSVITALAHAAVLTPPHLSGEGRVLDASEGLSIEDFQARLDAGVATMKQVFSEMPNHKQVADCLVEVGLEALPTVCYLTPGIPVKPMLAHPTPGISAVLKRFEGIPYTCEYKVSRKLSWRGLRGGGLGGCTFVAALTFALLF